MVHDPQTTELLSAYVDGEVDPRQKVAIERLLERDPQARALLADLRRNREILAGLPRHEAPASILTDIQAFTERAALLDDDDYHGIPDRRTLRVFRRLIPLAMAASLGFAALAGWYFYNNTLPGLKNRSATPWADGFDAATTTLALAADRPLEEKLAAGLPTELVQAHPFEAEPVRLAITVENESQKQAVLARLDADMVSNSIADLTEPDSPAVRHQAAAPQSFYVRGRAGVNHAADAPTQRLLRAPASQVAVILNDLPAQPAETQKIELQAGPLQVVGQQNAVDLLNAVSGGNTEAGFARQQMAQNAAQPRSDSPESRVAFRQPADRSQSARETKTDDQVAAEPGARAKDVVAKRSETKPESAAAANTPAAIDAKDAVAAASEEGKSGERESDRARTRADESAATPSTIADGRSAGAERDAPNDRTRIPGDNAARSADGLAGDADTPAEVEFLGEFLKNVGIDPEALVAAPSARALEFSEEMGPPAEPGTLTARRRSELERTARAESAGSRSQPDSPRSNRPGSDAPQSKSAELSDTATRLAEGPSATPGSLPPGEKPEPAAGSTRTTSPDPSGRDSAAPGPSTATASRDSGTRDSTPATPLRDAAARGTPAATAAPAAITTLEAAAQPEPYVTMVIEVKTADSPPARGRAPNPPAATPARESPRSNRRDPNAPATRDPNASRSSQDSRPNGTTNR